MSSLRTARWFFSYTTSVDSNNRLMTVRANEAICRSDSAEVCAPEMVSRERDFLEFPNVLACSRRNAREVCKTFIAGSIPAVASDSLTILNGFGL